MVDKKIPDEKRWERVGKLIDRSAIAIQAIAAVAMVVITGFIVHITKTQTNILANTDKTLNVDLVASNRAWIAPGDIVVPERFLRGESNEIYLTFGNTGREPAQKIATNIAHFILPAPSIHKVNEIRTAIEAQTKCDTLKPNETGFVSHPRKDLDSRYRILPSEAEREHLLENGLVKTGYFMVAGCFVYETFNEPRISQFCRFLDHNEGGRASLWPSTFCDYREYAD